VLDPKGNQMHFTYASPGTAVYYRGHGTFADGTVLVKEVFAMDHAWGFGSQSVVRSNQGSKTALWQ